MITKFCASWWTMKLWRTEDKAYQPLDTQTVHDRVSVHCSSHSCLESLILSPGSYCWGVLEQYFWSADASAERPGGQMRNCTQLVETGCWPRQFLQLTSVGEKIVCRLCFQHTEARTICSRLSLYQQWNSIPSSSRSHLSRSAQLCFERVVILAVIVWFHRASPPSLWSAEELTKAEWSLL